MPSSQKRRVVGRVPAALLAIAATFPSLSGRQTAFAGPVASQDLAFGQAVVGAVQSLPANWQPGSLDYLTSNQPDIKTLRNTFWWENPQGHGSKLSAEETKVRLSSLFVPPAQLASDVWTRRTLAIRALDTVQEKRGLPPGYRVHAQAAAGIAARFTRLSRRREIEDEIRATARILDDEGYTEEAAELPTPFPPGPSIERATFNDLEAFVKLDGETFPLEQRYSGKEWLDLFERRNAKQQVIRSAGRLAAATCWMREAKHRLLIVSVATHPDFRGRGYAEALLRRALFAAWLDPAIKMVTLQVETTNEAAQRLYRKLGFWINYRKPNYYGKGIDAFIMMLQLRP